MTTRPYMGPSGGKTGRGFPSLVISRVEGNNFMRQHKHERKG